MKTTIIAKRYAEAFFNASKANLDENYEEFSKFLKIFREIPDFSRLLQNPVITHEQKFRLLEKTFQTPPFYLVVDFIKILIKRNRLTLLPQIGTEMDTLYRKEKNIICVQIKSAVPLLDQEKELLKSKIENQMKGTVKLDEEIVPDLIGGLLICFEGMVLDASIKTKLKHLREKLKKMNFEIPVDLDFVEPEPS